MSSAWLIGRALIAVILMVGFYALGSAIGLGLLYIPYAQYVDSEIGPALRKGFRPPLVEGFTKFLGVKEIANAIAANLEKEMAGSKGNPYDTHPPLAQRLAALSKMRPRNVVTDSLPALGLVDRLPELEARMVSSWLPSTAAGLKPVTWKDTGAAVLLPDWTKLCRDNATPLADVKLDGLLETVASIQVFAKKTAAWAPDAPVDAVIGYACSMLGAASGCALYRAGWAIDNQPGMLTMRHGDIQLNPFSLIRDLRSSPLTRQKWEETMNHLQLDPQMRLAALTGPSHSFQ